MASLIDEAKSYEGKEVKNIADLPKVSTNLQVMERKGVDKDGKEFTYKVISVNNQDYRVPPSVLKQLKVVLDDNSNLKEFKVKKSGTGMSTQYVLVPLS